MSLIAIFNQKGGVGKTTTALNLAAAMRCDAVYPLLIDLDPQSHLSGLSGIKPQLATSLYPFFKGERYLVDLIQRLPTGTHLIPSHIALCKIDMLLGRQPHIATRLQRALHAEMLITPNMPILMDCCPMLGVLSVNAIVAAGKVLVPVSADYLSLQGAIQLTNTLLGLERVLKQRLQRRYLITRYQPERSDSQEIVKKLEAHFGDAVCRTRISESEVIGKSLCRAQDVFQCAPDSPVAKQYRALFVELVDSGFLSISAG